MMTPTGRTPQKLHQVVALAINTLVAVEAMIGNHDQSSFVCQGTFLDSCPYLTQHRIELFEHDQLSLIVVVVMSHVIKVSCNKVQVRYLWVCKFFNELSNKLVWNSAAKFKPHRPFVKDILGSSLEFVEHAVLIGDETWTALKH